MAPSMAEEEDSGVLMGNSDHNSAEKDFDGKHHRTWSRLSPTLSPPQNKHNGPIREHHHQQYYIRNATGALGGRLKIVNGEIYEYGGEPMTTSSTTVNSNANSTDVPTVVIRGEEIGIVVMVLLLWIGAIILFFNRWGKIRMLEPYQPKFCENHRLSCPMADVTGMPHGPRTYSKFNLSNEIPHFATCNYHGIGVAGNTNGGVGGGSVGGIGFGSGISGLGPGSSGIAASILTAATNRPRQNSVFVTSPHSPVIINGSALKNTSRKTKSAIDLSTLVLSEGFLENVRRSSKNSITHL